MTNITSIITAVTVITFTAFPSLVQADTKAKIDKNNPVKIVEQRLEKPFEFKADQGIDKNKIKKNKEKEKQKLAKTEENLEKIKKEYEKAKINDTTGFDKIYRAASEKYNVPWEILSAVHLIETNRSGNTTIASYAGAQGPMQFIPSTWAMYGVDGNGDGIADIYNVEDAIYSAANYLAASGANRGDIYNALFAYNRADWYVNKVLASARAIGYSG